MLVKGPLGADHPPFAILKYIPYKYTHCFVVFCFVVVISSAPIGSSHWFTHILQGCFTGSVKFLLLSEHMEFCVLLFEVIITLGHHMGMAFSENYSFWLSTWNCQVSYHVPVLEARWCSFLFFKQVVNYNDRDYGCWHPLHLTWEGTYCDLGPLLLTWSNLNPSIDK